MTDKNQNACRDNLNLTDAGKYRFGFFRNFVDTHWHFVCNFDLNLVVPSVMTSVTAYHLPSIQCIAITFGMFFLSVSLMVPFVQLYFAHCVIPCHSCSLGCCYSVVARAVESESRTSSRSRKDFQLEELQS